MNIFERKLVQAINSGKAFALVGAGPSCDIGLPTWHHLAEYVTEALTNGSNIEQAKTFIVKKQYADVFDLAEIELGLESLLSIIKDKFITTAASGQLYNYIVSWPFQSYLTTNFDDQLYTHLRTKEPGAVQRLNSEQDMSSLRSTAKNIVFKIHGDFSVPEDIVLTRRQYNNFLTGANRQYWRDTIFTLIRMFSLVLIGYSASDPHFNEQIERAKLSASPDHPVFMFAADIDNTLIHKYFFENNIHIISYNTENGNHTGLKRLLSRYDPFIAKRDSDNIGLVIPDPTTSSLASSLHIFTKTRFLDETATCITRSCAALLLQILSTLPEHKAIDINELLDLFKAKIFAIVGVDPEAIGNALRHLYDNGLIEKPSVESFSVSLSGLRLLESAKADRDLVQEKFENVCQYFLTESYGHIGEAAIRRVINCIKNGLITAFEKRGLEIANSVFTDIPIDISDAPDILDVINKHGASLETLEERSAFADLMIEILLKSGLEIKEYLGALSQGYFAYHSLALDPNCSDERLVLAKEKTWIFDSSIILPLLAKNSLNNHYAKDLLERMKSLGIRCCTTKRLFTEVQDHAYWAITNFISEPPASPRLLLAAQAGPGYKQNLFIDGFVKWSSNQGNPRVHNYIAECLGDNYDKDLGTSINDQIQKLEIEVIGFDQWAGFSDELFARRDSLSSQIAESRQSRNTYTGQPQCDAEAEVVVITEIENSIFLSQSGFLNRYSDNTIVWKPETMYRFLTLFSSAPPETDMLYQCMTQDFFYAGFDIIDDRTISNYAAPLIHQSRMNLEQERTEYEKVLGKERFADIKAKFEQTPDAQKPFYSMQFAYYVAGQAEALRKSAVERAIKAEDKRDLTSTERKRYERLKLRDQERKRRAKKRKRSNQARKSKGKKK